MLYKKNYRLADSLFLALNDGVFSLQSLININSFNIKQFICDFVYNLPEITAFKLVRFVRDRTVYWGLSSLKWCLGKNAPNRIGYLEKIRNQKKYSFASISGQLSSYCSWMQRISRTTWTLKQIYNYLHIF